VTSPARMRTNLLHAFFYLENTQSPNSEPCLPSTWALARQKPALAESRLVRIESLRLENRPACRVRSVWRLEIVYPHATGVSAWHASHGTFSEKKQSVRGVGFGSDPAPISYPPMTMGRRVERLRVLRMVEAKCWRIGGTRVSPASGNVESRNRVAKWIELCEGRKDLGDTRGHVHP